MNEGQIQQLNILEASLEIAINLKDYKTAFGFVQSIENILQPLKHFARLSRSKNKLYELAIRLEDFNFAINELLFDRRFLDVSTREYVETTCLLTVCFIRKRELSRAMPYFKEVLAHKMMTKTANKTKEWREKITNRLKEEWYQCIYKGDRYAYNENGRYHTMPKDSYGRAINVAGDFIKTNNYQIIELIMGDKFENIRDNVTIYNRSRFKEAFNTVKSSYNEEAADALEIVRGLVERSGKKEAGELFDSFNDEIKKDKPKKSVLESLWDGLLKAVPMISQTAGLIDKIKALFHLD